MALVAFQGQSSVVAMIRGSHNEQMQGQHGTQEGPSPCWRGSRAPSRWKQEALQGAGGEWART